MKRYYQFHGGNGYGFVRKGNAIPLATGIAVHEALAEILIHAKGCGHKVPPPDLIRIAVQKQVDKYVKEVMARGFLLEEDDNQDVLHLVHEQASLTGGLVFGWVRSQLPLLLEEFEIIDVEREEEQIIGCSCGNAGLDPAKHLESCKGILQMSRPDFVLRRKADDTYGIHDFKTAGYISDSYINEFKTSVQMAVGTLAVEARLGVPVNHYYVHALVKGQRKSEYNTETKEYSGPRRQNSVFCYAYHSPGSPPVSPPDWQARFKWVDENGKGRTLPRTYQKQAIWLGEFPGKPKEISNIEYWVSKLPEDVLHSQFNRIGPYERQDSLIREYMEEMYAEEWRWVERLWTISTAAEGMEDKVLRANVARSWDCNKYGSPCPYVPICFKHPGAEGLYVPRRPHHAAEIEEMISRGVPVPSDEPGEEEVND